MFFSVGVSGDYHPVSRLFRPLPSVRGTTFSDTNYNVLVCAGPLAHAPGR